jgi:hypothetical protein
MTWKYILLIAENTYFSFLPNQTKLNILFNKSF